uniref:ubiquitinyl hydrolase 1 n=1 Tax=Xiphophorus maculatus TaxID=8083 RepID=A0A3B5PXR2_XIPMA
MQKGLKKYFVNMDEYLSSLGLYRKMVARDASSLFRAVSEQLYFSQNYHQKIRLDCASFMRANRCNFEPFVEGSFEKYLERLEDPKETVGQVEIKVTLCCSINGHYDIIYGRSYPASAALCQSLLYELLYTQVFGVEGVELWQAMETFRAGGRRYRNSLSVCSDVDVGYDAPEDRVRWFHLQGRGGGGRSSRGDQGEPPPAEAPPTSRLCLPYKVLKSLDGDVYRNLEFDVWQDTCKEMQKTDYMVFAGRQYFLGDKCQVRLEPKGKFYNAFIQEVGTHSTAVTVFIEELGEKHLVPLTDLKPVNPVPAWNVAAPPRKGDPGKVLILFGFWFCWVAGQRGRSYCCRRPSPMEAPPFHLSLPASNPRVTLAPLSPHHQGPARFLNRQLIGPQLTYYHPGRRYYHDYENYAFRSRRSRRHLLAVSKECQFGFPAEAVEEAADLDPPMTFYQLEDAGDAVFPPLQVSPAPSAEGPASIMTPASPGSAPSGLLYPDQTALPAPTLLHLPFEAPPPAGYLPAAPHPPLPHLPHSSYHPCVPPSAHWGALSTSGHAPRVYCPAPSPHVVGYITAPHPHHTPTHYVPPSM